MSLFGPTAFQPDFVTKEKKYQQEYYIKHRQKKLEYSREFLAKNKDGINAGRRQKNRLKRELQGKLPIAPTNIKVESKEEYDKLYYIERQVKINILNRLKALKLVGGGCVKCANCGYSNWKALCFNHINGGGREEHLKLSPNKFVKDILSGARKIDDLNVLCMNCNILYEYTRGARRITNDIEAACEEYL